MPPANKTKLQSEKLALSKHVRKLVGITEQPVALSSSPKTFMSGIPRRTRASVDLTDDLLLQIKKGLESSVATKSKVKVKRLTSAVKQQISTKKSTPKKSPAGASRRLRSSRVIPEEVFIKKEQKILQTAMVANKNSNENELTLPTGISTDVLNKTPSVKDAQSQNLALESRVKALGAQSAVSSKSSLKYERSVKKSSKSSSSPKSVDDSPSNAYSLRSKPETFFPDSIVASSSKSTQKVKRVQRTSLPFVETTAQVPDSAVVATAPRTSSKQKKQVSTGDDLSVVPESKKRHSMAAELENKTEKRSKTSESNGKFSQLVQAVEKLETPRQAYKKRKSERDIGRELQPSAKKRAESETVTPDVTIIKDRSEKRLSVRVTRIEGVYGDKSDTSSVSKETPYRAMGGTEEPSSKEAEEVHSLKNADAPLDYVAYSIRSVGREKTDQQSSSVAGWGSTPDMSLNLPMSSTAKRVSGVHWDTAAIKTRLIESIHPGKRLTRSSIYSADAPDSASIDASSTRGVLASEVHLTKSAPRSILKFSSNEFAADDAMSNSSTAHADLKTSCLPPRRKYSTLCKCLSLLGLPIAVAAVIAFYQLNLLTQLYSANSSNGK
jgi:hypothetical protein